MAQTLFGDDRIATGVLWRDDNLERLSDHDAFPSESVDLVYLDPPFFSNRDYEVIWGDEAEVRSFEDRWEGGIQHYVGWMRDRVVELHRILKPTGTLYLHCDPHANRYLGVMLDGVFGYERFRNEIIWQRTLAKSLMTRKLPNNHDTVLCYQKGDTPIWNPSAVFQPYDEAMLDEKTSAKYSQVDPDGRMFQLDNLINPNPDRPNLTYEFLGVTRVWRWTKERMETAYADGLVVQTQPGRVPRFKRYLDEQRGRPLGDVWVDIPPLNSQAKERKEGGYPTQKPETLLERIISLSSNPGDVVLDPFCGCGTTVAVAERLNRRWIGIDISPTAIEIMRRRLWRQMRYVPEIRNSPASEEDLRGLKPFEFQNWVINAIGGSHTPRKVHDMGIDGYTFFRKEPVQVKQSYSVGRNVIDNFETAVRRAGQDTGHVIAFSFTRGAYEEAARAKADGLDISLIKVAQVLLQVRRPHGKVAERLSLSTDLPITPMRQRKDMPKAEDLVESERAPLVVGTA